MAGRKPKNPPMTQEEMTEVVQQKRSSRIYRAESQEIADQGISKSVINALSELKQADGRTKINMDDTNMVKSRIEAYLETCAVNSSLPSMTGIAMILGYTRTGLYLYMEKQNTETSRYLQLVHDKLADILSENALKNNANNITAIFLLKSLYGLRESQTVEFVVNNNPNGEPSINDVALRAGLLLEE